MAKQRPVAEELCHRYLCDYDRLPPEERFEAIIWTLAKAAVLTADGIAPPKTVHPHDGRHLCHHLHVETVDDGRASAFLRELPAPRFVTSVFKN